MSSPLPEIQASEETLWSGHPSHWHYFWAWVLGIVLAPVVVGLLFIGWIFLDRSRRTYLITRQRVILEWGFWAKNSRELRIKDIRSIALAKRGLLGLFRVGDVEFSSAATDDAEVVFVSVARAEKVRDLVRSLQLE